MKNTIYIILAVMLLVALIACIAFRVWGTVQWMNFFSNIL